MAEPNVTKWESILDMELLLHLWGKVEEDSLEGSLKNNNPTFLTPKGELCPSLDEAARKIQASKHHEVLEIKREGDAYYSRMYTYQDNQQI